MGTGEIDYCLGICVGVVMVAGKPALRRDQREANVGTPKRESHKSEHSAVATRSPSRPSVRVVTSACLACPSRTRASKFSQERSWVEVTAVSVSLTLGGVCVLGDSLAQGRRRKHTSREPVSVTVRWTNFAHHAEHPWSIGRANHS